MHDLATLNKDLKLSEFEEATALYAKIKAAGYSEQKAVAMIFKAGAETETAKTREWRGKYHQLKHEKENAAKRDAKRSDITQADVDALMETTLELPEIDSAPGANNKGV